MEVHAYVPKQSTIAILLHFDFLRICATSSYCESFDTILPRTHCFFGLPTAMERAKANCAAEHAKRMENGSVNYHQHKNPYTTDHTSAGVQVLWELTLQDMFGFRWYHENYFVDRHFCKSLPFRKAEATDLSSASFSDRPSVC
eukprot:5886403-Amphidinium_carterae.1